MPAELPTPAIVPASFPIRIAIVTGDHAQAEWLRTALTPLRHPCTVWQSAAALLAQIDDADCALLLLDHDAMHSGAGLLPAARNRHASLPALFIASRHADAEDEIAAAIAGGVNDYLVPPLRQNELRMRVSLLLRRAYPAHGTADAIGIGPYRFDSRSLRVIKAGSAISLTQKEFDLALLFFRHLGRPLSRAFIREALWPHDAELPSRTVDTHVSRVRSKLQLRPENGFRLLPVYSFGYRLEQLNN